MDPSLPSTRRRGVPEGCPLSPREFALVEHLMEGENYAQIGLALGIAETTARSTAHNAFVRLGVDGRFAAVVKCWRAGWLDAADHPVERDEGDPPLTLAALAYLAAFERWLCNPTAANLIARKVELATARDIAPSRRTPVQS